MAVKLCETWAYNLTANNWTNKNPTFHPGQMSGHAMVYDRRNKETFLHYGTENWVYSSATNNWSRFAITNNPPGNTYIDMAYDDASGATFLLSNGTWVWNETRLSEAGTFTSAVHVAGGPACFGWLKWDCAPAGNGTVRLQFRSGADWPGLLNSPFVGPGGTPSSYYDRSGQRLGASHNGSLLFQYKVYLATDNDRERPWVNNISVQYNVLHAIEVLSPCSLENWTGVHDITWSASDRDNDSLSFDIYLVGSAGKTKLAYGLPNSTRSWSWDTSSVSNGTYKIMVVARDNNSAIPLTANASSGLEFTIFHPPPENRPPEVTLLSPEDKSVVNTADVRLSWNGSDEDGDPLNYTAFLKDAPFWAWNRPGPLAATGETCCTAAGLADGSTYYWTVQASDGRCNGTMPATRSFSVRLPPPNNPPVVHLLYPADRCTVNTTAIEFAWVGTDAENDVLSYRLFLSGTPFDMSSLPTETALTRETRYVYATLTDDTTYYWTVMASDGKDNATAEIREFRVNMTFRNHAPVITSTPPRTARIGEEYIYNVSARDDDGDPLAFSLVTNISGMAVNSTTGRLTWVPAKSQAGGNKVTVRVTDSNGASIEQTFTVTVVDPAKIMRPACEITSPANGSRVSGAILVSGRVVKGSLPLVAVQVRVDGGEWLNATGAEEWRLPLDTAGLGDGTHTISARAFDGEIFSASASIGIIVDNEKGGRKSPGPDYIVIALSAAAAIAATATAVFLIFRSKKKNKD